jgi:hypothetical protein
MIEKKISFFWGNPGMSWLRYMTLKSFRKYHPGWEMNLYTDRIDRTYGLPPWTTNHRQDFFNYTGKDNFLSNVKKLDVNIIEWKDSVKHIKKIAPSQKSNFFKWKLLAEEGGFYSDMDVLYFSSIDDLRDDINDSDCDTAITHNGKFFSIGFMASSGNNAVFKGIYDNCVEVFNKGHYQGAGVWSIYRKWGRTDKNKSLIELQDDFPDNNIFIILMDDFYLLNKLPDIYEQDRSGKLLEVGKALHWYAGGELAQEYNNFVKKTNYSTRKNTISEILKYIEA